MLIFLAILLLFAVYLFWASTDVAMTKSRVVALYAGVAFITLLFQIYVRSFECEGLSGCALSFSQSDCLVSDLARFLDGVSCGAVTTELSGSKLRRRHSPITQPVRTPKCHRVICDALATF